MKNIVFCIVDDIELYATDEIKSTIRNILDFTISNLYTKGYKILIGKSEDDLLKQVTTDYAVVMSPGTEYINGFAFFESLDLLLKQDFFVAGHILDRSKCDAYYELHHQCYVINMKYYRQLGNPIIGQLELNSPHNQIKPIRSDINWHDDYTPISITPGTSSIKYSNRCHGWNVLSLALQNRLPIIVFDQNIRNNKRHYYPESEQDFYKHKEYIDYKFNYCKEEFIHVDNTEWSTDITETYEQVVLPASGTLYLDLIEKGRVIFYDYNRRALEYWKENCPRKENISYHFVHTDLLNDISLVNHLDPNLKTLINLSNIFCYEGTVAKYSRQHRATAEKNLISALNKHVKDIDINFTLRANDGH